MGNEVVEREDSQVNACNLKRLRKSRRESQAKFWKRFGVTQSRGSRFEQGLQLPVAVAILVKLYFDGKVNDRDLWQARHGTSAKQTGFFNPMGTRFPARVHR